MSGGEGEMASTFDRLWDQGVAVFSQWEATTSKLADAGLRSPLLLEPAGRILGAVMELQRRRAVAQTETVRAAGLASAHDLDRTLHAVERLTARVLDLQESIETLHEAFAANRAELAVLRDRFVVPSDGQDGAAAVKATTAPTEPAPQQAPSRKAPSRKAPPPDAASRE